MEEGKQGAFIAWWTEVVVQRTVSGDDVEESPVGHKVGNIITMVRSLCELEWGKRRGWGSLGKEACKQCANKKKDERGGPIRKRERESRADKRAGKRGAYRARGRGECGAMPWPREHGTRGSRHRWRP
jgi:hypothetical protein